MSTVNGFLHPDHEATTTLAWASSKEMDGFLQAAVWQKERDTPKGVRIGGQVDGQGRKNIDDTSSRGVPNTGHPLH